MVDSGVGEAVAWPKKGDNTEAKAGQERTYIVLKTIIPHHEQAYDFQP